MSKTDHRLALDEEAMRRLGRAVVEAIIAHMQGLPDKPVARTVRAADMIALFRDPLPKAPKAPEAVLERVLTDVFENGVHVDHPRFFSFVPGPNNFVSVMADALAAGFNTFAGTWFAAGAAAEVERTCLTWLREAAGLPGSAGGLFTTGGSAANLVAMAAAREIRLRGDMSKAVIYAGDQAHSAVERAARILGFPKANFRKIPSTDRFRVDMEALRAAIAKDRRAGLKPFCIAASAGTTNTGAVDPLPEIADLCAEGGLWFHIDGAYGASACLSARARAELSGMERADSIAMDPHKWLFQPYEIGCVFVREARHLHETFHILPDYLVDTAIKDGEINYCDHGPQLTRSFRALKLWMSLQVFGADAFEAAIDRGFDLAEAAGRMISQRPHWRITSGPEMAVVTFRIAPPGMAVEEADAHNAALVDAIRRDGQALITSTKLKGRTVLRLCTINPRTEESDIALTLDRVAALSGQLLETGSGPGMSS